jgi:hypothetical protein
MKHRKTQDFDPVAQERPAAQTNSKNQKQLFWYGNEDSQWPHSHQKNTDRRKLRQNQIGEMSSLDWAEKQTVSLNRSKALLAWEQTENQSRHQRSAARDFCYDEKWSANSSLGERGAKREPGSLIVSKTANNSRSQCHSTRYGAGKQKTISGVQIEVETWESFHRKKIWAGKNENQTAMCTHPYTHKN